MDEQTTDAAPPAPGSRGWRERIGQRAWVRSAAWVGGGLVAGGILAGTVTAAASDDPSTAATGSYGYGATVDGDGDGRGGHHGRGGPGAGETELTGDTADSVRAAVLEEYPGATIERLETDSDGVYEAHLTTADGEQVTVELDEAFAVTGTEDHPQGDGPGGHGGRGGGGAGETELTGDTADSVRAAVLEEYPGATIERLETDSDGVYEAHLTTADGEQVTVELDEAFAVTGTE